MFTQCREQYAIEHRLVCRFEYDRQSESGFNGLNPPTEPGAVELRSGRYQVIALRLAELEEFRGHHGTDFVTTVIRRSVSTTPITEVPGHRILVAGFEFTSEHVLLIHACR